MIDQNAFLPVKPAHFHILLALADTPRHGWGIIKAVEERTGGRLRLEPSPLYRRIRSLFDDGLVVEVEAPQSAGDERRRYYRLTELGLAVVRAESARLIELTADETVRRLARGGPEAT